MKKRRLTTWLACAALAVGTLHAQEATFRHPGLLHSEADFESIRQRIAAGDAEMTEALNALRNSRGIVNPGNTAVNEEIIRGITGQNYMNAYRNAHLAYQCALMWKITGETSYADRAVGVLNAYRIINKRLGGNTNISLIPAFTGYPFVNAAELLRDYRSSEWGEEEFELFKQYLVDVWFTVAQDFLERRHDTVTREGNWYHYHSNWGVGNALFCVSLGILCDEMDLYNYGMYWLKEGPGNESLNVTLNHPDPYADGMCGYGWGLLPWFHADERGPLGYLNQMQESGRDQGHSMAALGLLSYAFQSAYNQGDNAFCNLRNSAVPGKAGACMVAGAAEYVAAYNSGVDDLPYRTNWWMTGLNATGRGQWRPIWQLFINHYENRMGIPMKYCHAMEDAIGMEMGGGSYGNTSGGYDHTGFGDLMHNDGHAVTEDEVPSILFPQIASPTETRNYAEISGVEPGTTLTLSASLLAGEEDTGQWTWDDGSTGRQRMVTAERSGLYRVTYRNARGVESTQLFSVAVRGEGVTATLGVTVTYNGQTLPYEDDMEILMGQGRQLIIATGYSNWNYIESEVWTDNGVQFATGGTITYDLADEAEHRLVFRLTTQGGAVVERRFTVRLNPNDLSHLMADPDCEDVAAWTYAPDGFRTSTTAVGGFSGSSIELFRAATQDGMTCWGLGRFDIGQTLERLAPGKYTLGASLIATQQGRADEGARSYVDDIYFYAGGATTPVATLDGTSTYYTLDFYVGDEGTATVGLKNMTDQDQAYSDNGANWVAMDNYSLVRHPEADVAADLAAMRAEAGGIDTGLLPAGLAERVAGLSQYTADDVATAVRYQQVLGDVRMVGIRYAALSAACARYQAALDAATVDHDALRQALQAFASAATAEAFFEAYAAVEQAWKEALATATATVDLTDLLPEDGEMVNSGADVWFDNSTRWMTESAGGNFRIFAIDGSDTQRGEATDECMIERWCTGNFTAGERVIYAAKSNLPAGRYTFRAAAQKGSTAGVMELFANDQATGLTSTLSLAMHEVAADVTDGLLAVGLRAATGNGCQWVSMSDVALAYTSPVMLLDEALAEAATLTYGDDTGGALAQAVADARAARADGTGETMMDALHALQAAIEQYRTANASAEHPLDMTGRLANPSFDLNNASGWTVTGTPGFAGGVAEFYRQTFDLSQTLTGLPVGNYRVSAQARSDAGADNSDLRIYAQTTGGTPVTAYATDATRADGTDTSQHLGQNADDLDADPATARLSVDVFVGDGRITVGAACGSASMWCVLNDFRLEYLGMGADDLLNNWRAQVAVANALDRDLLPAAVETLLAGAVDVDVTSISHDSLSVALSRLMNEIENARAVMAAFEEYLAKKNTVDEIAANSVPNLSSTLLLLNNSIASASANVENATTAAQVRTERDNLETARQSYVVGAVPTNGVVFDMTFKVASAACSNSSGWLHDGTVNFRTLVNTNQNGEFGGTFLENWIGPGNELKDGARAIYQEVTGLPNGNYRLTAAAFRKVELSSADPDAMNVGLYLNQQQEEVASDVLDYWTVDGVVTGRTAEIGLKGGAGNTANWIGLADVTLLYYGTSDMTLSETDTEPIVTTDTYGNVSLELTLQPDVWNLVCLPFDLSATQTRNTFDDVKVLTGVEMDGGTCNLQFEDVRTVTAGVPCLVQVSEAVSVLTFNNMTVKPSSMAEGTTVADGMVTASLRGTSCRGAVEGDNLYAYAPNAFTRVESGTEVNGFRAYLQLDGAEPSEICLYVDGVLTAVHDVKLAPEATHVDVYTTDGRLLRKAAPRDKALEGLPAGIYVVGGKKVVR